MSVKTAKPPREPAANADIASLQVSLPQMLDLALGTPEVGAVNLNILHNFLHVLLHQINLRSTKVEYRGEDANRVKTMVNSIKSGPTVHLHEYSITDGSGKVKHRIHSTDTFTVNVDIVTDGDEKVHKAKAGKSVSAPVTEREKTDKEKDSNAPPEDTVKEDVITKKSKGTRQQIGPGTENECETIIYVEPIVDGSTPTALGFRQLQESVNELQHRFQALKELSTNPELVERLKGRITDPLTDVWQIINITKRLDASEEGIDKLTTMVQDVIKGGGNITTTEDTSQVNERITNLETTVNNIEQAINNLQAIGNMTTEEVQIPTIPAEENTARKHENVEEKETGTNDERELPVTSQPPAQRISLTKLLGGIDVTEMHGQVAALKTEVARIHKDMNDLNEKISKLPTGSEKATTHVETATEHVTVKTVRDPSEKEESNKVEPAQAPKTDQKDVETMKHPETIDTDTLKNINERIVKLERDVICLSEKVDSAPMAGVSGASDLNELVARMQGIQNDMEKLHETADHLIDDRENREVHLNALLEQVELLKTIKADKEDLEDALADKADAQIVNRKVSYDQFDAACDDLARGLEDAISKLGKQESIWQQALDEVQREIEGKVDKIEITPLRDFVSNRLKSLQNKLKGIAEARRESEAAGTKKLLRDVQCISCDKNVVMKMEDTNKFRMEPLPCTMSMKPYLTYELDQVRKQQRRLPHSRNMIQFEAALQEESKKQKSARTETLVKTPRDHLCNRYCGGSHTVTTPQQRVMRMGHFLTQWGPEIVQLTEGFIKGKDGKMYRSRPMPGKTDVCGSYSDRVDEVETSDRPSAATPRRKSVEKRASTAPRKRSSRKYSAEVAKEPSIEEQAQIMELPRTVETPGSISDMLPIDPTAHSDEIIQYEDDGIDLEHD